MTEKYCTSCGETKPREDFYRDRHRASGRTSKCKPCHNNSRYNTYRARASHMLNAARNRASRKGLEVSIDTDWVEWRLYDVCEVTGLPFEWTYGRGSGQQNPWSPSLDRIDPTKGYTPENTRCVVFMYNAAKHVASDEDLLDMAHALVDSNR